MRYLITALVRFSLWIIVVALILGACASAGEPSAEEVPAQAEPMMTSVTVQPAPEEPVEASQVTATEVVAIESQPQTTLAPEPPQLPNPTPAPTSLPMIPEARRVIAEWPPKIRAGESDVVRLVLEMDDKGNLTPTTMVEGAEIRSETVLIPNLYETHSVMAEARLDMAGVTIIPPGSQRQSLFPGESIEFFWSVSPTDVGDYRGTVWLLLHFSPLDGGEVQTRAISAQMIEIRSVNLLGLGGTTARILGAVGTVIGSLLGLDDVFSWLRRRRVFSGGRG